MGCFLLLFALISPRLALILTWLFSDVLSRAFDSCLVPLIGFFILPWTTLAFAWIWDSGRDVARAVEVGERLAVPEPEGVSEDPNGVAEELGQLRGRLDELGLPIVAR